MIVDKDITKFATIHTESKTKYFVDINSVNELKDAVIFADKNKLDPIIIGKGTNILFTQKVYTDKLFMKLGKNYKYFTLIDNIVEIGASYPFMKAGRKLISLGYKDFIYMSLIPGSLGGGVRQNAGTTNEGEIKDNFISATVFDLKEGQVKELNKADMNFSYRNSILQENKDRYVVLSAKFSLGEKEQNIGQLKDLAQELKKKKLDKEPSGYSFGSTFKSVKYEHPVWWYIDKVGMRGKTIGQAKFSEKHSNWIINEGTAKAEDIIALIEEAKQRILEKFNINLQVEVELI
jgi:UDP-N-acetylmuramate dehydrogenase